MVKKCHTCNTDNREDARFCSACGRSLISPKPTPTLKPSPTVKTMSYSGQAYPGDQASTAPAPTRIPQPGMCFYHTRFSYTLRLPFRVTLALRTKIRKEEIKIRIIVVSAAKK